MTSRARFFASLLFTGLTVGAWSCASDEPAIPGGDTPDAGSSSSSSSSSTSSGAPAPVPDAGTADGGADAGSGRDEQIARIMAATAARAMRCDTGASRQPESGADLRQFELLSTLPGVSDDALERIVRCVEATALHCVGSVEACRDLRLGSLPLGSPCQTSFQCESAVCSVNDLFACGTCIAGPGAGAPCPSNGPCGPGLECDESSPAVCAPSAIVVEGATCNGRTLKCGAGVECVAVAGSGRKCIRAAASGGICKTPTFTVPCAMKGTEYCDDATSLCLPRPTEGQSCAQYECSSGFGCEGTICRAGSRDLAVGAICRKGDLCVSGAECTDGTCTRYAQIGESCAGNETCARPMFCNWSAEPEVCGTPVACP